MVKTLTQIQLLAQLIQPISDPQNRSKVTATLYNNSAGIR